MGLVSLRHVTPGIVSTSNGGERCASWKACTSVQGWHVKGGRQAGHLLNAKCISAV